LGLAIAQAGDFGLDNLDFGGDGSRPPVPASRRESPLLKASLLPETAEIVPGKPFRLVLALEHRHGVYSYWINPGGPGLPARMDWRLPEGFAASPPVWPAPELSVNSGIVSHVIKGTTYLIYTVIPPENIPAGTRLAITGILDTQVCTAKTCIPIKLPLKTRVQVLPPGATMPEPSPKLAMALAKQPEPIADWRFEASSNGDEWLLMLIPAGTDIGEPAGVHFFEDGAAGFWIDSQKPQQLENRDGAWTLRLPKAVKPPPGSPVLSGVLRLADTRGAHAAGITLPLPEETAAVPKPPATSTADFLVIIAFAFFGGLILNIMPCVFPVIGLKIMSFARQAHSDRRLILAHGAAYAAGVLLCFWVLAAVVIGMGRGWGAQLQSEWLLFILCHLFVVLSMNMAGAFEFGAAVATGGMLAGHEGVGRSFLTGLLATLASTPCSAPFLGAALAYALSAPIPFAFLAFTMMGLGFAFPYVALAAFPRLLKRLPKPGLWMETFRQAMSFPLFAAAAYLAWTLEAMLEEWHFLALLLGLVLSAFACWVYGRAQLARSASPRFFRTFRIAAILTLAAGIWLSLPRMEKDLEWRKWSPEEVSRLRSEGRPVYVDFTARWCATCQINKRVWLDRELVSLALEKGVALLKADWTSYDERIADTLRREFNRAAVPVNVLYAPGGGKGLVMPEILTVGGLIDAFAALPD
jgi:thiol:disulfide interchange protein DsbD